MVVYALFAGGFALALLVLIYWRTAQSYEGLKQEVDRLRIVQRDMTSDVRSRLEEGEKSWGQVELEMRPRLEQLEPTVADLSSTLRENLPTIVEARERLEAVEARVAAAEAELRAALESGEEKASARNERIENAVRALRNAADERLADLSARLSAIEMSAEDPTLIEESAEEGRAAEAEIDFRVVGGPASEQDAAPEAELVGAGMAAEATSEGGRGTSGAAQVTAGKSGGGRWVVVLLALVAGIALVVTALA